MPSHLTNDMLGKWLVFTATSAYLLDLDARTAVRRPVMKEPADKDEFYCAALRKDGEPWSISSLITCEVGSSMEFMAFGIADDPSVATYRRTTPVQSIVEEGVK